MRELTRDREAESASPARTIPLRVAAVKSLEDACAVLLGDARTGMGATVPFKPGQTAVLQIPPVGDSMVRLLRDGTVVHEGPGDTLVRIAEFMRDESCGQCVPCRVGTVRQVELLERLRHAPATSSDLGLLSELGQAMRDASRIHRRIDEVAQPGNRDLHSDTWLRKRASFS